MFGRILVFMCVVSAVAACGYSGVPTQGQAHAALRSVNGCGDLLSVLREAAIEDMRERVMQNLEWALESGGCMWFGVEDASSEGGGVPPPTSREEGASEYSTTNTQEAGVDEADFVKNDNQYIYMLAGEGLMILDAWPPEQTREIATAAVEGIPRRLYVHNDIALVYSDIPIEEEPRTDEEWYDCWYGGYDCYSPQSDLKITVFDIGNKQRPVLLREIRMNGSYMNSRRIGDAVHTVVLFPQVQFPGVRYWPSDLDYCGEYTDAQIFYAFVRLIQANERIIHSAQLEDWLPSITDTRHLPGGQTATISGLLQDCRNFYEPSLPAGQGFLTLLSVDVDDTHSLHATSIVGRQGVVYASHQAMYVAIQNSYNGGYWYYDDAEQNPEATTVHKFTLSSSPPASTYAASGVVKGRVLNQFSMGEYNNHLRLATTTGRVRNPETHNSIFVLEQHGSALHTIGMVTGLAPSEDIRSARFVGDRGFVVTFKKTDPLYAIDLSDPRNPVVAGELKIPGFSTYIHMMDDDHLLTIGFDAEDHGSFAYFQGIELQIFDVSDLSNPLQKHKEIIGTRGSSSEATGNHLAFNYFPPKEVLALPMAICEDSGGGGSYGDRLTFSGLLVYDTTTTLGFAERGRVPHADPASEDEYSCSNWWTNPASRVKRSIIMDDFVFSISDTLLKVNHLDALQLDLVELELPPIPENGNTYGY